MAKRLERKGDLHGPSHTISEMKSSASIIAVIPTLLYGIGYAANILKNGIGEGDNTNDWYGFAVGGVKSIPVAFAIILAVAWGIAAGMLALRGFFYYQTGAVIFPVSTG